MAIGPGAAQQRLGPEHWNVHQIDTGVVGRGGLAMHFQSRRALAQNDIGECGTEVDTQPHRRRAAAAQFAIAAPATVAIALQRALPDQITESVTEVRGIELAYSQLQGALLGGVGPIEAHVDLLQRGDPGADARDIGGRGARLCRRRPERGGQHEERQDA